MFAQGRPRHKTDPSTRGHCSEGSYYGDTGGRPHQLNSNLMRRHRVLPSFPLACDPSGGIVLFMEQIRSQYVHMGTLEDLRIFLRDPSTVSRSSHHYRVKPSGVGAAKSLATSRSATAHYRQTRQEEERRKNPYGRCALKHDSVLPSTNKAKNRTITRTSAMNR